MKKISYSDLISNELYESQRAVIRQSIMEHKKTRRVQIGPNMMLHFEDFMLMRYQVQELMRTEKLTEEKEILEELDAYNPLIPDGRNLKVTMMDQIRFRQSDSPIAYASVTEENIVSWIKTKLGSTRENKIYARLVKEMTEKESVPVSKGVPWEN